MKTLAVELKKPTPERGEGFRFFENVSRFFAEAGGGWFEAWSEMLDVVCFFENAGFVFENADCFFADV